MNRFRPLQALETDFSPFRAINSHEMQSESLETHMEKKSGKSRDYMRYKGKFIYIGILYINV